MPRPYGFHDLSADSFPFTIEFLRSDNDEVIHVIEVPGPGFIDVPALSRDLDCSIWTRVSFANNTVVEHRDDQ